MSVMDAGSGVLALAVARVGAGGRAVVAQFSGLPQERQRKEQAGTIEKILASDEFERVQARRLVRLVAEDSVCVFEHDGATGYFVMCEKEYPERLATALLRELAKQWEASPLAGQVAHCKAGALARHSKPLLRSLYERYSDPATVDKLSAVQAQVEQVTSVMEENVKQAIANSDTIVQVSEGAESLQQQADMFAKQSHAVMRREQWKNLKLTLAIAVILLVIVGVMVATLIKQ